MIAAAKMQGDLGWWRRTVAGLAWGGGDLKLCFFVRSVQGKWSMQRPQWLMRSWMDPSTTTRTGLTLRLTSSPPLCALTQTHPATSWVCSASMFSRQYNRLVPSFLCKRELWNYGHMIITENDVQKKKKKTRFQWHSERCGIRTPSIWHQAESFGQRWLHKDPSRCGRSPGQDECDLGAGSGMCKSTCILLHGVHDVARIISYTVFYHMILWYQRW